MKDVGININDPRLLVWWDKVDHRINANAYNDEILRFIEQNGDDVYGVINKVRELLSKYGF